MILRFFAVSPVVGADVVVVVATWVDTEGTAAVAEACVLESVVLVPAFMLVLVSVLVSAFVSSLFFLALVSNLLRNF